MVLRQHRLNNNTINAGRETKLNHADANAEVDAVGLWCPEPLILARHQLRHMATGEVLLVKATDPSTRKDFSDLCRFVGHELLQATTEDKLYCFWIRKS